jgi:NADPH-dependent curcumin reductase
MTNLAGENRRDQTEKREPAPKKPGRRSMATAQRIVLASRPVGEPKPENFRLEEVSVPTRGPGQLLLRTIWLSLDPYMRGRMSDAPSYAPPVRIGDVMEGGTVSEVVASGVDGFDVGEIVVCRAGWQTHFVSDGRGLRKIDPKAAPTSTALGVLGMPGMTAYTGLLDIGKPQPGETVVVAAASGAVGSAVGQIARIKGARAIGIAGGAEKCAYVKNELGFDECFDYKAGKLREQLKDIDVYFDNVGGEILDTALARMKLFGRVVVCGTISDYNATDPYRVRNWRAILVNRLKVQGMIVFDWKERYGEALKALAGYHAAGRLKTRESVVEGLANAPQGLIALLKGGNFGKQLVKLA